MKVLNIGGNRKSIPLPVIFDGWDQVMLDIDPHSDADIICDARSMTDTVAGGTFDAICCAHNFEHYFRHDLSRVTDGFLYALKDDGFAFIQVPNMRYVCEQIAAGADIEDVAYTSPAGPIRYVDMIYGLGAYIANSGNDFMSHKNGFTPLSLGNHLVRYGFPHVFIGSSGLELWAYAFKNKPSDEQQKRLKLKYESSGTESSGVAITPDSDLLTGLT